MRTLEVHLAPQTLRQLASPCCGKTRLPLGLCERCIDLSVVMRLILAWTCGEVGQLPQQRIQLYRASLDRNLRDARAPSRIDRSSKQLPRLPRVGVRDHDLRMDALAAFENDTFARQYLRNGNTGRNDSPRLPRSIAEVERHHAHAAL